MHRINVLIIFILFLIFTACHKKNYPAGNVASKAEVKRSNDSLLAEKKIIKRKPKVPVSKVIVVNDSAARKSVDGRLYYDVLGHRYWRNYKDGKYYLFNKSMFTDPAFKKPG